MPLFGKIKKGNRVILTKDAPPYAEGDVAYAEADESGGMVSISASSRESVNSTLVSTSALRKG